MLWIRERVVVRIPAKKQVLRRAGGTSLKDDKVGLGFPIGEKKA